MAALIVREGKAVEHPARLGGVVVRNRRLEVLAQRRRFPKLAAEPAEQADGCLVGHVEAGYRLMDTYLAIASRRDERRYLSNPLPASAAERILDAGRLSGSAQNRQPWIFVVPEGRERIERLARAVFAPQNVLSAGLVVGILVSGKGPTAFDAGRAAQNMLLAAWNEGLSSCPNGIVDAELAAESLGAGDEERPVIVLSFGIPGRPREVGSRPAAEWSARANRKPLADVVRRLP